MSAMKRYLEQKLQEDPDFLEQHIDDVDHQPNFVTIGRKDYATCSVDNLHPNWKNQELHPSMEVE